MIQRATTAEFINAVVNHPAVRPFVHAPPGPVDLSAVVVNPNHLVLTAEYGGMVLFQHVPGLYEIHTQVLPKGRGEWALNMAQECVRYLFTRTAATEVFTRVPEGNVAAMALARACGAKPEYRPQLQHMPDGDFNIEIYGGRIQDWIKIAPGLEELGAEFHDRLHAKAEAAGIKTSDHAKNPWHDRNVGAAAAMILGGQVVKGVTFYNRWAAFALAPPITLQSLTPTVIDITDCRLLVEGDDFQVIPCQLV